MTAAVVDLHAHTRASDGADTSQELVAAAASAGLEVLAVTDHDTVEGVAAALEAGARLGVEVLPGCEVTADVGGRVVHLLAYGDGLLIPGALDRVTAARQRRNERNHAIGEKLEALTGVGYRHAVALAGSASLSRAHFARALVEQGAVAGVAEAFDRYLSNGRPAYVPAPSLPLLDVVELVHELGGVAALAHPGRLAPAERERVVAQAIACGIDGLEVWHCQHDRDAQRHWLDTVRRHGLLATGGSDYHGTHKPGVKLGSGSDGRMRVPPETAAELTAQLAARVRS